VPPDELSIIDRYFRPLAGQGAFDLRDDAGALTVPPGQDLVVTSDMVACSVHFLPGDPSATIAQKALRVNLSDLAGKGAKPLAYVLSLGVSSDIDDKWLGGFAEGLRADQRRFGIGLLGGDTISVLHGPVVSITAFGLVASGRMVHRFGGKPGDELYVSGTIGAAAAGLALLKGEAGAWSALPEQEREALVQRYRVPEPRTGLAAALTEFASAAMDISDGLVGDCDKLCAASGCSAMIEAWNVPLPAGLSGTRDSALMARLITAGDDFEILAAVPSKKAADFRKRADEAGIPVARIGVLTDPSGAPQVLFEGTLLDLPRRAYVHGRAGEQK
jgi:thiamine-monophosphate kinase